MQTALLILQIVFSIGIIIAVLLQPEGTGLGSTWGGGGGTYHTKRGVEKVLFYGTIVIIVLFTINSLVLLII